MSLNETNGDALGGDCGSLVSEPLPGEHCVRLAFEV